MGRIAEFIFELGMLKKTPRTGYQFLGNGSENVAAHSYRTAMIAYVLAKLDGRADVWRTVAMALMHDVAEARIGDHNYVNRMYVSADEVKVTADQLADLPFGSELADFKDEFEVSQSLESKLARDADQLDLIFELREKQDLGNRYASKWIESAKKRLTTPLAIELAGEAMDTDWTKWWYHNPDDEWWVHGRIDVEEK